jgi:hypothetical protein
MWRAVLVCIALIAVPVRTLAEPQRIELDGEYVRSSMFSQESIEIRGKTFTYGRGSDEVPDSESEGFPVSGALEIDGNRIELDHWRLLTEESVYRVVVQGDRAYLILEADYLLWLKGKAKLSEVGYRRARHGM